MKIFILIYVIYIINTIANDNIIFKTDQMNIDAKYDISKIMKFIHTKKPLISSVRKTLGLDNSLDPKLNSLQLTVDNIIDIDDKVIISSLKLKSNYVTQIILLSIVNFDNTNEFKDILSESELLEPIRIYNIAKDKPRLYTLFVIEIRYFNKDSKTWDLGYHKKVQVIMKFKKDKITNSKHVLSQIDKIKKRVESKRKEENIDSQEIYYENVNVRKLISSDYQDPIKAPYDMNFRENAIFVLPQTSIDTTYNVEEVFTRMKGVIIVKPIKEILKSYNLLNSKFIKSTLLFRDIKRTPENNWIFVEDFSVVAKEYDKQEILLHIINFNNSDDFNQILDESEKLKPLNVYENEKKKPRVFALFVIQITYYHVNSGKWVLAYQEKVKVHFKFKDDEIEAPEYILSQINRVANTSKKHRELLKAEKIRQNKLYEEEKTQYSDINFNHDLNESEKKRREIINKEIEERYIEKEKEKEEGHRRKKGFRELLYVDVDVENLSQAGASNIHLVDAVTNRENVVEAKKPSEGIYAKINHLSTQVKHLYTHRSVDNLTSIDTEFPNSMLTAPASTIKEFDSKLVKYSSHHVSIDELNKNKIESPPPFQRRKGKLESWKIDLHAYLDMFDRIYTKFCKKSSSHKNDNKTNFCQDIKTFQITLNYQFDLLKLINTFATNNLHDESKYLELYNKIDDHKKMVEKDKDKLSLRYKGFNGAPNINQLML